MYNKEYAKSYRDHNRYVYNCKMAEAQKKFYNKNKDKVLNYKKKKYIYSKEAQIFRNILLDELT